MHRAAGRAREAPDRAAAKSVERPGLRACQHGNTGDADGDQRQLDAEESRPAKHDRLQNGDQKKQHAVKRPHQRIFIGRVHRAGLLSVIYTSSCIFAGRL